MITDEQAIDMWLSQPEGFSLRIERLGDEISTNPRRLREWFVAAYRLGKEAALKAMPGEPVAWSRKWNFMGTPCQEDFTDSAELAELWRGHPQTDEVIPLYASPTGVPEGWKFARGDTVEKTKGSSWHGKVVGFYSTELTPRGYVVESDREPGSCQLYPEAALAAARHKEAGDA